MMENIMQFFHKLEIKIRRKLSQYPILYAIIGGVGIILFWRGVWHLADDINMSSIISVIVGSIILIVTGVFVSAFIGNQLIISGLIGEKKLTEKEEGEIETEETQLRNLKNTLSRVEKKLDHMETHLGPDVEEK